MTQATELKRGLGLALITFYGLGNILGAGIYVLIGEVAAQGGMYAPVSFLLASLVAAVTACGYAELSARLPLSAGESVYLHHAFGRRSLSVIVGLLIALAGMVSAATISRGFAGYLAVFVVVPDAIVISLIVALLGVVAAWGIRQSVLLAALFTLLEIFGLLLVIAVGHDSLGELPARWPELVPGAERAVWFGIFGGAFVAFYAYIGFEDMVNVAEEVKAPTRNLPLAILIALIVSSTLYLLVALTAALALPPAVLAESRAPLATLYQTLTGAEPVVIGQIALLAVVNGALIQIIMASRILYGMSRQGWLPARLGRVHPRTRTPVFATAVVTLLIWQMALWMPVGTLARITSLVVLLVFAAVNLALWRIKRRDPDPVGIRVYPVWVPLLGVLSTVLMVVFEALRRLPL